MTSQDELVKYLDQKARQKKLSACWDSGVLSRFLETRTSNSSSFQRLENESAHPSTYDLVERCCSSLARSAIIDGERQGWNVELKIKIKQIFPLQWIQGRHGLGHVAAAARLRTSSEWIEFKTPSSGLNASR